MFLEVLVPNQDNERSGICVLGMSKLRYSEKNIKKDVPQHLNVNYVVGLIPMRDMEHN
jgi:hypothetical protein